MLEPFNLLPVLFNCTFLLESFFYFSTRHYSIDSFFIPMIVFFISNFLSGSFPLYLILSFVLFLFHEFLCSVYIIFLYILRILILKSMPKGFLNLISSGMNVLIHLLALVTIFAHIWFLYTFKHFVYRFLKKSTCYWSTTYIQKSAWIINTQINEFSEWIHLPNHHSDREIKHYQIPKTIPYIPS